MFLLYTNILGHYTNPYHSSDKLSTNIKNKGLKNSALSTYLQRYIFEASISPRVNNSSEIKPIHRREFTNIVHRYRPLPAQITVNSAHDLITLNEGTIRQGLEYL